MSTEEPPERRSGDPSALVGRLIVDRYQLQQHVSSGANTTIYDGTDVETGRPVTIKLLRPSIAASPSFRERFDDEMQRVAALSHQHIVAVYDWGIAPLGDISTAYVVTERLGGGSLRDLFDRGRRLSPSQALSVGLDACRGLHYAHRRGFVHTELSPAKLVFGDDRQLRIADLGLARLLGEAAWETPDAVPNHVAWYAAPEQGLGGEIDGRADVYALALSLHEAVTGELPFKTDSTVATLAARVGKLMPVSADLGPLAAVFERAGRPDAEERATAAEFGQGLMQAASKLPRPEPIPLLSTGLFETPVDQMRSPDDPTGGVTRPPAGADVLVVPATPDDAGSDDAGSDDAGSDDGTSDDAGSDDDRAGAVVSDESPTTADGADAASDDGGIPTAPLVIGAAGVAAADEPDEPDDVPPPPVIVEAEPDQPIPTTSGDELVILPIDSDFDGRRGEAAAVGVIEHEAAREADDRPVAATTPMPVTPAATAAVVPRRRRGFPWKSLLALLLVAALIVLGILASRLFQTPEYVVPDLVGVPEAEARNTIAANDWEVVVEREQSDIVPVKGEVVRTAPSAGVSLAEGEPFLLVVSDGPRLRELPDSTGLTLGEAQTDLNERGLVAEVREEFDEDVPPGIVISWSVPGDPTLGAGSRVLPETMVELVVSAGPAPRTVPDIRSVPSTDARGTVEGLQLVYVEESEEFSDDVAAGLVLRQVPEPGVEVERGATVTVVVSKGPDVVPFPDLSGAANYTEAADLLIEAGFVPRLNFGDAEGELLSVTIDGAEPEVGATFRRGTEVLIDALTT